MRDHDPGELPSRDPRKVGRKHRYGYLVQSTNKPDGGVSFGGVIKHDYSKDTREVWRPKAGEHGGEWLPETRATVTLNHVDESHRQVRIDSEDDLGL